MGSLGGTVNAATNGVKDVDHTAIVIGAGLSGVRMVYELKKRGIEGKCFEAASGIGGTWFWNRYPGARSDSEVWLYILTFLEDIGMETKWTERFPTQKMLEEYLNQVVDFLKIRQNFQFDTRIASAHYNETKNIWTVTTTSGVACTCTYLITATGPLSATLKPPFAGLDSFKGEWYQTSLWPDKKIDFRGKRVGVFGTGATGVQIIPIIAHSAKRLTVFQRTPNYVLPARNFVFTEDQEREMKEDFPQICQRVRKQPFGADIEVVQRSSLDVKDEAEVQQILDFGWERGGFRYTFETFSDMLTNPEINKVASEFLRRKIRAIVHDPVTAEALCPYYPFMCKRPPLGHFYYETFNRPNVELINLKKDPVQEITPTGIRTLSQEYDLDMIIFGIGFDAVTGALNAIDIRGAKGVPLKSHLEKSLATGYGITVSGFPNMFTILGPQSSWANLPTIIDHTADWIGRTILHMQQNGHQKIETNDELPRRWTQECDRAFHATLLPEGAIETGAWYVGGNVEGKTVQCYYYFGGVPEYMEHCEKEIQSGYPGFKFSSMVAAH